ncbi:MAG: PQQ-binding-like beta-propeller repeat protein, partial [Rubripirellula sp.]
VDSPNPIHPMNSFASPTPVLLGKRVICHFGGYGTWCLDSVTGETIWQQKLLVDDSVGPGSSPILFNDQMIVACDGIDKQFVAALSIADGSIRWKTPRPPMRSPNGEFQKAYSTPLLINVKGQSQLVVPGAQWCVAYDPNNGSEIWRVDHGDGFSVTPMPIMTAGKIIFSTGYITPELVAVDPTGRGDVTETHVLWRQKRNAPAKPSMVSRGKVLFVISDTGILSALNTDDGSQLWRQRLGGAYSASPLISDQRIMVASHTGEVTVFAAEAQYRKLGGIDIGEQIMASPITIGSDLVLRTEKAVYRFSGQ